MFCFLFGVSTQVRLSTEDFRREQQDKQRLEQQLSGMRTQLQQLLQGAGLQFMVGCVASHSHLEYMWFVTFRGGRMTFLRLHRFYVACQTKKRKNRERNERWKKREPLKLPCFLPFNFCSFLSLLLPQEKKYKTQKN